MGLKDLFHKKNQATMKDGNQVIKVNVAIFNRSNDSACLARVQSDEMQFNTDLPLNQDVEVAINTDQKGEFNYACGMNMFHGKVVIK